MKTYVLTISKVFPATHPKAGAATGFKEAFERATKCPNCHQKGTDYCKTACATELAKFTKKHTIRANYPLWEKRIAEIQRGEACLSVRQWTGKPYRSKQEEVATLTMQDGVGLQKLTFSTDDIETAKPVIEGGTIPQPVTKIAAFDGLTTQDWKDWFRGYDLKTPLAVIHFTHYRYL